MEGSNNAFVAYNSSGDVAVKISDTFSAPIGGGTIQAFFDARNASQALACYNDNSYSGAFYARNSGNGPAIVGLGGGGQDGGIAGFGDSRGVKGVGDSIGVDGFGQNSSGIGVRGVGQNHDFYAGGPGSNYSPFTGSHDGLLIKDGPSYEAGDIVEVIAVAGKSSVSSVICILDLTSVAESKGNFGAIVSSQELQDFGHDISPAALSTTPEAEYNLLKQDYYRVSVNGVGEGQVNVCNANGNIEVGDFITSSAVPGKGQAYHGNDMRVVVARALEPVVWADEPDTIKMVACIYMCG
jgi:hypothetical protein